MSTSSAVRQTPQIERQAEQQVERDGRADHFGEIARGNRDLAEDPENDGHRARVVVAARLRQVAPARDAEAHRERLQQDRHQVRQEDHAEQRVAVAARRRRGRSPSCPGPCSRPRRDSPVRQRRRASARSPHPVGTGDGPVHFAEAPFAARQTPPVRRPGRTPAPF